MKKRILSLGLLAIFVLSMCCVGAAAAEARASSTLTLFTASASKGNNSGEVKISYDVQTNTPADKVGISSIAIYKSDGSYVTTVTGTTGNGLVRTGAYRHKSTYVYTGTSGTSYYAVVTGFATIGSDSDSRTVTTSTIKAP
ncbi:MAG: hypothetical protein HFF06_06790 [Oscillospiraceae bacterium]|jgi:hypothetical protein|nr:hypothetical protein [Oscillospiraceae bacterium]